MAAMKRSAQARFMTSFDGRGIAAAGSVEDMTDTLKSVLGLL